MDDETSSRIRDLILEAGRRQRQLGADTEAAKRQVLATTLRLAGHTVSQHPVAPHPHDDSESAQAEAQPNEPLQPNDNLQLDDAAPLDSTLGADSISQPAAALETARLLAPDRASSFDPSNPPAATQPDEDLQIDDLSDPDDTAESDDSLQIDDPAPDDDPDFSPDPARSDATAESGESDTSGDMLLVDDPASPAAPDAYLSADEPALSIEPVGMTAGVSSIEPQPTPTGFGSFVSAADSAADSIAAADSPTDDTPPDFPLVLEGDSASLHRRPAPGIQPNYPSPGAGSLSISPSVETDAGSADGDEGDCDSITETAGDKPGSNGDTKRIASQRSIDVTPVHGDEIQTEVVQKVIALIDARVAERIDQLRHERFVSRAAWSSAFPR